MQPNVNFGASNGGNGFQSQKTPYRIFSNFNYCSSCGGHVHDDHTSATCKMPGPNHNRNATRQNMMGGSTSGMHKTIMPEQCDREANRHPQPQPSQGYLSWATAGFQGTKKSHEARFKGQRQQQQQQPRYQQANMMAPQLMTPSMVMQPGQMQMMQQPQMQMLQPQQMMAPMMQMQPMGQQQQHQQQHQQQGQQMQQQGQQQQQYAGFGAGNQMGSHF
jgi:hypothetical protein